jgi:hypothetical protein
MLSRLVADGFFLVHAAYIAFVGLGGLLVWRRPRLAWVHLPAAAWGVLVQFVSWACPLTALENSFRRRAGQAGYEGGFIEHYLEPLVYPANLTPHLQMWLAVLVVLLNATVYALLLSRRGRAPRTAATGGGA